MSTLFNITSEFSELFEKFDELSAYEPDTDADGNYIDTTGNIIPDVVEYRNELLDAWFDTLSGIECEFTKKAANCGAYIKQLKSEATALDDEMRSLRSRSAAKKREIDQLEAYIINCMDAIHLSRVDEPIAKLTIRNNPESAVIADTRGFIEWAQTHDRDELLKYSEPEIRKTAVKAAIKSGEELPGVSIERTRSLMVK